MEKYVCIHGHYYQPPRENPWLEVIEYQDSAHPFHDWNERINVECYAPNASSRILNDDGLIKKIVNNYAKISFNMGATLLSWLEDKDPETYQKILDADKESMNYFSGHGSAIAQAYSHLIMPLASDRDKRTQVRWGIDDFKHRFKRMPEGMWLAETAVDTATLEILAEEGIKYTVLAPRQAKAFRKVGDKNWEYLQHAAVDPRLGYWYNLPSGKKIALFFYDGRVAQDVAFNNLLSNGASLANRILETIDYHTDEPQLAHIATDGESYGHHHRYGEMALSAAIKHIDRQENVKLTNYGEFLELCPPTHEIQIYENSSWSCVHGVERWRSNCGCHTGGGPGWHQKWRAPLREALDWLSDELNMIYERKGAMYFENPWAVRDAFIEVMLDRSEENVIAFLEKNAIKKPTPTDRTEMLRLLELQRNATLMYTSCGWFFNDVSGIETSQILKYACRSIYYARQVAGVDLQDIFIKKLEAAPSNIAKHGNAGEIYRKEVLPAQVGLEGTGMHFAVASLFDKQPESLKIFNYTAQSKNFEILEAGRQKLAFGETIVKSHITHSEKRFSFAVLYLGQQHIIGHISLDMDSVILEEMKNRVRPSFESSNIGEVIRIMQLYFGPQKYSINTLFKDEKIQVLNQILNQNLNSASVMLRGIYKDNYHLMNTLLQNDLPVTLQYKEIVQYVLNEDLEIFFKQKSLKAREIKRIVSEFKKWDVEIEDRKAIQLVANNSILEAITRLRGDYSNIKRMKKLNTIFEQMELLHLSPAQSWRSQNEYFVIATDPIVYNEHVHDELWRMTFERVGKNLGIGAGIEEVFKSATF
ncbi:MAG: alpha-amylase/alpha-mannosidase (GH57 family) [Cognaticolwellia sp.]|jgi:alpha-amylase/alpha-mannosidase (GH57 family)